MRTGTGNQPGNHAPPTVRSTSLHPSAQAKTTLQSWKEIAAELNRGVRTVQRWERELKMPVRRVGKGTRCPVFAFKDELYRWLRTDAGLHASGAKRSPHNAEGEVKVEEIQNLFKVKPLGHTNCTECGSGMKFLKGQFWIYGTNKKWSMFLPVCPVCHGSLESFLPGQSIH